MPPQVKEFTIDYTQCEFVAPNTTFDSLPSNAYHYRVDSTTVIAPPTWQYTFDEALPVTSRSLCKLQFQLLTDMKAPVFMYYKRTFLFRSWRSEQRADHDHAQSRTTTRTTDDTSSRSTRVSSEATPKQPTTFVEATAALSPSQATSPSTPAA